MNMTLCYAGKTIIMTSDYTSNFKHWRKNKIKIKMKTYHEESSILNSNKIHTMIGYETNNDNDKKHNTLKINCIINQT